jgi:hypothetical protein
MIPAFAETGLLPDGIYWADMNEIKNRYGYNVQRQRLIGGLARALRSFRKAGCSTIYLDGSFVTAKVIPGDYDACWEAEGVNFDDLDPVLLDFSNRRATQKAKYFGEFFPADFRAEPTSPYRTFLNFFQTDKSTGDRKGIVGINLTTL